MGIIDLKLGLKHGMYIQEQTYDLYSWGDNTYGATGNEFMDDLNVETKSTQNSMKFLDDSQQGTSSTILGGRQGEGV